MVGRLFAMTALFGCSFVHGSMDKSGPPDGSAVNPDAPRQPDAPRPIDAPRLPDAATGSLSIVVATMGRQDVNLTTEGTTDWAHWGMGGNTGFDHRSGSTAISNLVATPTLSFTGAPLTASWNNGTPIGTASQTDTGVAVHTGSAMTFTAPAGTTMQTLRVYVGVQQAAARLDVTLSDASATAPPKTLTNMSATQNVQYTILYKAASNGQTLTVSWTDTTDYGNPTQAFAALLSATLN